ncbi:MAG TPA: TolC family protein [Candidatus Bathyarchaeia archaeon]|nr:TolC family protein [Candidatus Bathyarchaeia archaeon]
MKRLIWNATVLSLMIFSGLCHARPAADDSLTVAQAVRMTLENHPLIQQAGCGVAAADARVGASRSPYYPDISAAGLYTLLEPVASIDFPGLGSFKLYPPNNYDVHLGVRETLYDFGKVSTGVELAQSARRGAADYVDVVKSNLAYQTVGVFDAMLILRKSIVVLDEQIEALEQHLAVSVKKMRAGTATDFDSLTTEVRIAAARNDRIDAGRALETQEILLRQLTGFPADRPIHVRGIIDERPVPVREDSVLEAAKRQRPELVVARDAENTAAVQARLASLGDKPSLVLGATAGFKNGYIPDLDKMTANVVAGAQLLVPIFNGSRTRHQKEEADANVRSTGARTADVQRQVVSEVEQAIAGVRSSRDKIENSRVQVTHAEAALARAQAQYEAGVATNLDLLDVQTALSQAKLIRLRAVYEYTVSLNALDKATGRKIW